LKNILVIENNNNKLMENKQKYFIIKNEKFMVLGSHSGAVFWDLTL
jgi:hypothetical protein